MLSLGRSPLHRLVAGSSIVAFVALSLTSVASVVAPQAASAAVGAFPVARWTTQIGATHLSSPTVADVNRDGVPDVVTADLSGWVHVLDGHTGSDLPGWPQRVQPKAGFTTGVESSPAVADLDRNGQKEIVVTAGSLNETGQNGGLVVFRADGSVRFRMQTLDVGNVWSGGGPDGFSDSVEGSPAVGDIDGSGYPSIVFGAFDQRIYAINRFGGNVAGFPFISKDSVWDSPALYDSGHLGRMDIFIGGDASPGGPCGNLSDAGVLRDIRFTGGNPQVVWQHCQHQIFQSSAAIGDLEGNGRMALVIGTGLGLKGDATASKTLSAFHLDDGSPVPGWPVLLNGPIFGSPVIGDINGDGRKEVVVGACAGNACPEARVYAFNGAGALLWSGTVGGTQLWSTPVLVDLNGDGINDVAVGALGWFSFLDGRTGATLYLQNEVARIEQNSAAVADFGPGWGWRLIVQSWKGAPGNPLPQAGTGQIDSFPLPVAPATAPAWPQWRLGPDHLAAPIAPPPPPAHQGYWLVAADGGIFAFGNAGYYGSTGAVHLNQPIVGMASTPSGRGYWLVASDGGIFAFGDAAYHGSTGAIHLNRPIVGMTSTLSGQGYWLVATDGGIFTFGDAAYMGSTGAIHLNRPIVGMSRTVSGHGYRMVATDGGIFTFGDAVYYGSTGAIHLNQPIMGMANSPSGGGYWLFAVDGGVFTFRDAGYYGSTGNIHLNRPIVGESASPAS